jgi:hypothetical protein
MAVQVGPLILYGEPGTAASSWAFTDPTGDGGPQTDISKLANGRPADQTAFLWGSNSPQTTADYITIQRTWNNGTIVPGVITVRNVSGGIPAGTLATVKGQRVSDVGTFPYGLGGNSVNSAAITFADGSVGWVFVLDSGLTAIQGYELTILNSNGSSVVNVNPNFEFFIGETMCYKAWTCSQSVQSDWAFTYDGTPQVRQSTNNQPWVLKTRPYRRLDISLCAENFSNSWGLDSNPGAVTYDSLGSLLVRGGASGCIVRTTNTAGALDTSIIHRLCIFGMADKVQPPKPLGGDYYQLDLSFIEAAPGN